MQELINGMGVIGLYIIPAASLMLIARRLLKILDELFRKILHFILLGAYIPFLFAFETWWISAGVAATLIIVLYPILLLAGRIPAFSSFVNERKKGEFKSSMILALGIMVLSISICWGIFDDRYLVLASIYAWGVGDAFAALIGKQFGKHKIRWKIADSHKSIEGSVAMFLTSAISVYVVLVLRGGLDGISCLVIAVAAALICTFVELCTSNGFDTVSCPTVAMLIIIPLVKILGG